jgi:hypothetical protein
VNATPLRVTLAPSGSERALHFARHGCELALGERLLPGRLAPLKANLAEELRSVRKELRPDGAAISWKSAQAALAKVKKVGGWLLHDLLAGDSGRAEELENFLRYVVPEWRGGASGGVETWIEPSRNCPRELTEFPFEFLPVFDRSLPDAVNNLHALARSVSGLLGYSTILVRHREEDTFAPGCVIKRDDAVGLVPVTVFRDEKSLPAVKSEIAYIAFGTAVFCVIAHWPDNIIPPAEDALARVMFSSPGAGAVAPQVLHFSCHYASGSSGAFTFADESKRRVEVTLKDLKSARIRLNGPRRAPPLVFLNACESSSFDPTGAMSLIDILREDGNAAVVGAETQVPDNAGAFFARRVFARLAAGQPLGEAVLRARWDLIEEWHSVAGIFFSLHGRTDLRIS